MMKLTRSSIGRHIGTEPVAVSGQNVALIDSVCVLFDGGEAIFELGVDIDAVLGLLFLNNWFCIELHLNLPHCMCASITVFVSESMGLVSKKMARGFHCRPKVS